MEFGTGSLCSLIYLSPTWAEQFPLFVSDAGTEI